MASLSTKGSVAGNPTAGLVGNMKSPITPFVPETQKTQMGILNLNANNPNGIPTAAGNASASGADYFKGLLNSSNPTERQAGQTWLSHQTTPGLLPKHPVKSITTSPDGTTKHTFDTTSSNDKTTDSSNTGDTATGTNTGNTSGISSNDASVIAEAVKEQNAKNAGTSTSPTTPTVGTPTQNAQNVLNQSDLTNNPEYQNLAKQQNLITKAQFGENNAGTTNVNPLTAEETSAAGGNYANLFAPQTTASLSGQKGIFNPILSATQSGNAAESQRLLSAAGLATGGAENVLGASTLSPTGYGQTNTSGLTGVQDSGKYGTGPGAAANVASIKDLTTQYNAGLANLKAADGIQNQIVSTLNANPTLNSTPLSGITNLNELLSGQISSGPQQQLSQQIASYINTLGLDPASVANIAHQQSGTLAQLLDSLRQTAQTQNDAKNPVNLNIPGSSSSSSTSGLTGDGLYDF